MDDIVYVLNKTFVFLVKKNNFFLAENRVNYKSNKNLKKINFSCYS